MAAAPRCRVRLDAGCAHEARGRWLRTIIAGEVRWANTTEMTLHEISEVVGVHNISRVSEVLNGKR
jgi:hypothetical protein